MSRRLLIVALLALLVFCLAACAGPATDDATGDAATGPFTIGISNGFVSSEWRTQMIQNLEETNTELM